MTREEHNRKFGANRQPDDLVISRLGGGEESQYDSMCAACYVGRPHTWREHDSYIEFRRAQLRQWGRSLAKKGLPLPPPEVVQGFDYIQEGYEELIEHDQYQESLRHQPSLPSVDPSADDYLEQLFAWGDAFVKMSGVTAEDVDEAERRVEAQYQGDVDRH